MDFFSSDKLVVPQRGDLLISEPYLPDPNFERTVVYLCEHDSSGSFGFVLNKMAQVGVSDVVDEINFQTDLYIGGPVQQDTLHYIHRDMQLSESSNLISEGIFWGGNYDILLGRLNTKSINVNDIRFFLGYSGWSAGQLIQELKSKSWIVLKCATQEMIFEWDNQELWKECLKIMGGKYRLMSNYPKDPRLN